MSVKYLLTMILAITFFAATAMHLQKANDLIGTWKYTVSSVPPEYETGMMTFEQKDDKTTGYSRLAGAYGNEGVDDRPGQGNIQIGLPGRTAECNHVTQDGDKLTGTIVSQDGEFPITAVKSPPNRDTKRIFKSRGVSPISRLFWLKLASPVHISRCSASPRRLLPLFPHLFEPACHCEWKS